MVFGNKQFASLCGGVCLALTAALWLGGLSRAVTADDEPADSLAAYYGFGPLEIYKLQQRSTNLLAADLNNDNRTDLILIDNSNSRLDVLQQRANPGAPVAAKSALKVNAVENDKRFEHRKIALEREISSLAIGDFNSDGRKDLVWFGVPDQLTIAYQSANGDWTNRKRIRLPDVQASSWIIATGDLNGDKKDDVAVLGKHDTYILYQQPAGELGTPVRLMNTGDNLMLAQIADLDGDGRNDLCYLTGSDPDRPLCVRLQSPEGRLGPELRCELPKARGQMTIADIDGRPGVEILAIEGQTGRVKIHQLQQAAAEPGELAGQLIQFGFGQQGAGKNRDLATGDVDGDGLVDVLVTDPESAQVIVFLQHRGSGLDLGSTFPGLMGAEQIRVGDIDGDGKNDVVVLSSREKTIGLSKMENGRLTFPKGISLDKEPVAFDLVDLNGDKKLELVYVSRERTGQTTKYSMQALSQSTEGDWRTHKLGDHDSIAISAKSTPERLTAIDANRDGRPDFLIFAGNDKPPLFLLSNAQGVPVEVASSEGGFGLGTVAAGGLSAGMLDQPVILVAQNNFARNVAVGDKNQWQVLDQYNASEAEAKIVGTATIDLDGQPGREIVLIDQGVKKLRVLRKEGMVYRPWREVDIGAFPYRSAHVVDLDGDGREDLLLFGLGKFGVLYAGRSDPRLKTLATYESKLEKVKFTDVVAGDLNSDGQMDLAIIDTQSQMIDIVNYTPAAGLRHALQFKVFEAKGVVSEERTGTDPREALIADVTGDGKADLVLLSQDRVLVYPQDDGKPEQPKTAGK
ncbi:MAG: VCBS repeat-containing protein [Planctomycetes bacterium]|nr:VCBS repeat-containing protein [Planctomycetota bacterium]